MKYKFLDNKTRIFPIGFGTFAFDNNIWRPKLSAGESIKLMIKAYEKGVNYFNSSYYYGQGRCEVLLGRAAKIIGREKIVISTKIGLNADGSKCNLKKDYILNATKAILKRMDTEYIDVLLFHEPDPDTPLEESIEAISILKDKGLVRYLGLSNFGGEEAKKILKLEKIKVFEFYFSLLTRNGNNKGDKIYAFCKQNNINATPYKVIERGILTNRFLTEKALQNVVKDDYRPDYIAKNKLEKTYKLVSELSVLSSKLGISIAQLAIAWILHEEVMCTLISMRSLTELEEDINATKINLDNKVIDDIENIIKKYNFI